MRALITGSAGFVGRHIARALAARGDETLLLDNAFGEWFNCMNTFTSTHGYKTMDYDVVFHCAAFVNGREGIDGSPAYLHTYNTMLDAAMFTWALRKKPGRVVYFSSSAAYPAEDQFADAEQLEGEIGLFEGLIELPNPKPPEASYGLSKLHGEQMALDVRAAGVPVTVLRPFSGYGADQDPRYPFRAFVDRARRHDDPFEVWGDGTQVRDWIHISDLVGAALAAVDQGVDGPVNVCTGIGTSFTELAELSMAAAGYRGEIRYRPDKPAGVAYRVGDPTLLHTFYQPKVRLEDALRDAVQ